MNSGIIARWKCTLPSKGKSKGCADPLKKALYMYYIYMYILYNVYRIKNYNTNMYSNMYSSNNVKMHSIHIVTKIECKFEDS